MPAVPSRRSWVFVICGNRGNLRIKRKRTPKRGGLTIGVFQVQLRIHPKELASYFVLLVVLTALLSPPAIRAQETQGELVKVQYDPQKDATQISLNPVILISRKHEELRLGAVTGYPGKTKVTPKEVVLVFVSLTAADVNKYESARKLTVIIGEQRLPLGETKRAKQTQNGVFIETMMIGIPMDLFLRLGRAKAVTLKLGFTEVALTPAQLTILRAAGSYMTE